MRMPSFYVVHNPYDIEATLILKLLLVILIQLASFLA
jgi:hypothetical protein